MLLTEASDSSRESNPRHPCVTIGICSFQRPSLDRTLRSLVGQSAPGWSIRIVVADNDTAPSAKALVARVAEATGLACRYIHAPSRNISIARNACLDAAAAEGSSWLVFIDDDEVATPGWLAALLAAADDELAASFGPAKAIYRHPRPFWLGCHDTHSNLTVIGRRPLKTGHTSNVLINLAHLAVRGRRFDLAFGQSGGEDEAFFRVIFGQGGRFGFAANAVVEAPVSAERDRFGWLAERSFRTGLNYARMVTAQHAAWAIIFGLAKAMIRLGLATVMALLLPFSPWHLPRALLVIINSLGFLAHFCGMRPIIAYGSGDTAPESLVSPAYRQGILYASPPKN